MSETPQDARADRGARLVHYSGRVQGVGFRATARDVARGYRVTGWVRNLPDGRVRLLAEGDEAEVDRFLAAVRARMGRHIEDEGSERRAPAGQYPDFRVAH